VTPISKKKKSQEIGPVHTILLVLSCDVCHLIPRTTVQTFCIRLQFCLRHNIVNTLREILMYHDWYLLNAKLGKMQIHTIPL